MTPHVEPMAGERTGITTARVIAQHGPIVGRALGAGGTSQYIETADGKVFSSWRWPDGDWLPWAPAGTHSADRYARACRFTWERPDIVRRPGVAVPSVAAAAALAAILIAVLA